MADMPKIENIQREPTVYELKPWKSIHDTITKPMVTVWAQRKSRNPLWRWDSLISLHLTYWVALRIYTIRPMDLPYRS